MGIMIHSTSSSSTLPYHSLFHHYPIPLEMLEKRAPLVQFVQHMLSLHEKLAAVNTTHDKTVYQRQIEVANGQIDLLVYKQYG